MSVGVRIPMPAIRIDNRLNRSCGVVPSDVDDLVVVDVVITGTPTLFAASSCAP
jgi:hypothetical protein